MLKPGVIMYTCNPSTQEAEDHEFVISLGYTVRPCLKKTKAKTKQNKEQGWEHGSKW
jgi:hypothetical protein